MSSPRRAGAEVNILAMLDGRTGKPLSKRFPALPRAAWYGAAGVLAVTMLGTLAWLAHSPDVESGQGTVASLPTPIQPAAPASIAQPDPVPEPAPVLLAQPVPPTGATIVNVEPPRSFDAPVPAPAPAPTAARTELADAPPATRPVAQKTALAHAHAAPASKPATAPARTASGQARPTPAARKHASAAAKPGQAPVDTDVALISAIIQHVNKRGELKENPEPPNKP
jgi:hypothetical protein